MAKRARDLERLQEQEADERGRNRATLFLVGVVVMGLFFAAFALWHRVAMQGRTEPDPLDRFLRMQPAQRDKTESNEHAQLVDPAKLTFERALTGSDDRPEVLAALDAAAREEERLSTKTSVVTAAATPRPAAAQTAGNGEFVLHVMSYETKKPADSLAQALRERGHEAFVTAGGSNGRGRYYRVRIGPFPTKAAATTYRRAFETRERMSTIVVQPKDEE